MMRINFFNFRGYPHHANHRVSAHSLDCGACRLVICCCSFLIRWSLVNFAFIDLDFIYNLFSIRCSQSDSSDAHCQFWLSADTTPPNPCCHSTNPCPATTTAASTIPAGASGCRVDTRSIEGFCNLWADHQSRAPAVSQCDADRGKLQHHLTWFTASVHCPPCRQVRQ